MPTSAIDPSINTPGVPVESLDPIVNLFAAAGVTDVVDVPLDPPFK